MITNELNQRFNIAFDLVTEYAVSLPFITLDEERFFTFEWIEINGETHLLVHDLYVRNCLSNEVTVSSVEDDSRTSERIREGVKGIEAFEVEKKYMELYEMILADNGADDSEKINSVKQLFDSLITDKALIDAYKFFGDEWVD